jgi:hypothetical protein
MSYDPHGIRKLQSWAQIRVFVNVIPASALLYIINFANCYQNGPQKARKQLFGQYTRKIIGVSGELV